MQEAGPQARGAMLYVNLEPCSHTGKTPPCADAVIQAGVSRVVVARRDPNPLVAGTGLARLTAAGIAVTVGVCEVAAQKLNEAFVKYITTRRPFVTLKSAITLDGKIATRTRASQWITGERARQESHRLRHAADAILVGIGTVLQDDPQLTTRLPNQQGPILCASLSIVPCVPSAGPGDRCGQRPAHLDRHHSTGASGPQ